MHEIAKGCDCTSKITHKFVKKINRKMTEAKGDHNFSENIETVKAGAVGSASDFGRRVPGSIPVRGVVCCGLEQVTFPQLNVYSVHMFLKPVTIKALQSLC